jgi:outer membrane biosynthesis protein TonB
MPDAARVAQAHALDVPIVLRGAKAGADPERPELFTETARTVLVFDNGAVLHLHSKLKVGQTVFIHNTQNGREILCKVLEAPKEGELGLTDLEFTTAAADFWGIDFSGHSAAREKQSQDAGPNAGAKTVSAEQAKMVSPSGKSADDPLAMMLETSSKIDVGSMTNPGKESGMPMREELMSAHEMAPDPSAMPVAVPDFIPAVTVDAPEPSASVPTGEQIDAALKQMSGAATPLTGAGAEGDATNDEKHIAALMARDARLAKFAAFKEKQQAEKAQRASGPSDPAAPAAPAAKAVAEPKPEDDSAHKVKTIGSKPSMLDQLTTGKNANYSALGACVLIAVAIFFIWRAMHVPVIPDLLLPDLTTSQPKPAAPAAENPSQADAASGKNGSLKADSAQLRARGTRGEESAESDPASSRNRRFAEPSAGVIPAQVLSQPQPTLPPWAVGVQVDGIISMDVTIDEKGNVAETKIISGPRELQREAERAVGLWQFQPAQSGGKPVASHMRLSVEFLPPPPPKRFP